MIRAIFTRSRCVCRCLTSWKNGRWFVKDSEREPALAFIDELVEGGGDFIFTRGEGGGSLKPASDGDLASFQNLVRRVKANEGAGFDIHLEHVCSDRPGNLVDLLVLRIDD